MKKVGGRGRGKEGFGEGGDWMVRPLEEEGLENGGVAVEGVWRRESLKERMRYGKEWEEMMQNAKRVIFY